MKTSMVLGITDDDKNYKKWRYIKAAGFDAIDIGFYHDEEYLLADDWKEKVIRVREVLDEIGLVCMHTHMPSYELCVDGEIINDNEELAIRRSIEASKILGANVGVMHPRSSSNHLYDADIAFEYNLCQFNALRPELEKYDFKIAIENIPVFPDGPHAIYFSSDYHDLIRLVDALDDRKHFGICWDFGHAHLMSFSQVKALNEIGDRIIAVHVHNNSKTGDFHQPPSCGSIKWPIVMKAFGKTGYRELLSVELPFPPEPLWESWLAHIYDCTGFLMANMD